VLVGRYSGNGDSAIVLEGKVNGTTRKFTYEVNFPRSEDEHEFVPRLWATRRVGYLLDEIRLHGENSELREEVTELARKYGIVTPYTAYLIVEDEEKRNVPLAMQSLPRLRDDTAARREATLNWDSFKVEKDGGKAVAGARYGDVLKQAAAPSLAAENGSLEASRALGVDARYQFSGRGGGATPATTAPSSDSKERLVQFSEQGRFVRGKNFYQNNSQWVDADAQKFQNAKRQRIEFNSSEYFDFAAKEKRALPYLALGDNVQFVLDETVYEIYNTK
jgi:Ca-activated chloride channel family protein